MVHLLRVYVRAKMEPIYIFTDEFETEKIFKSNGQKIS